MCHSTLHRVLGICVGCALFALLAGCGGNATPEPHLSLRFRDVAEEAGLGAFRHENGTFIDIADSIGGVFQQPMIARAVAKADYDRDGDVDLLVTENNGSVHILRNDSHGGGVLRVRLEGRTGNRDALGAHVTAITATTRQQRRVRTGSGYLAQSEKVLTFGLGAASQVDTLLVRWPSGHTESFTNLPSGHEIHLIEGEGIAA